MLTNCRAARAKLCLGVKGARIALTIRGIIQMGIAWFNHGVVERATVVNTGGEDALVASCLAAAGRGDITAYFDLGVAFSTGSHGARCDMIEAHKWFNLAAVAGHEEAAMCRADVADEMTAREIAEAQRRAREWLSSTSRRAA